MATGADGRPVLNGIDYLEVVSSDQTVLQVHFIHPLPGEVGGVPASPPLTISNVSIEGGVRVQGIQLKNVHCAGTVLTLEVMRPGDFSTYTLRLVQSPSDPLPPQSFDPRLSQIEFSFKIGCLSNFDCAGSASQTRELAAEPELDYLARDYATYRQLLLDRLSVVMPGWAERNPADLQVALIELLAYVGDSLSYYQDAVATEAYLGTARKRVSVRRHARLLDYFMHEGCNARAWVCFEVDEGSDADGATLPSATQVWTRGLEKIQAVVKPLEAQNILQQEHPDVFESLHEITLHAAHNRIRFYTWSNDECCLPTGTMRATLLDRLDSSGQRSLSLKAGDVLIFEETRSPTTGLRADADPAHRCAVRLSRVIAGRDPLTDTPVVEVEWHNEDALPFSLHLTSMATDVDGEPALLETAAVRANVVLVDHGVTVREALPPVPQTGHYRPTLARASLTFQAPFDAEASASAAMKYDAHSARPAMSIESDEGAWTPQYDLLTSAPFAREFVVEMQTDGMAQLRFGDGISGKKPAVGGNATAIYRRGNGAAGNVGAEAIARVVWHGDGVRSVRNPMAATGGNDPESLEQVRQFAPRAFRKQERAVTAADYAEIAERNPEVQQAAGTLRWTGSWYTAFVTVDRTGGRSVDEPFTQTIRDGLERYRMAGFDVAANAPTFVPLDVTLEICVRAGYFQSDVRQSLLEAFGSTESPNGRRGFFHPDNFTFGQAVYVSQIYRAAMQVDGVASVSVTRLQRWGGRANGEIESGVLKAEALEIIQLANDPNFPENGRIELLLRGGL